MAKGPFNIWFKNLAPGSQYYWGEGTMWKVGTILVDYFTQSCAKTSQFSIASYSWDPVAGQIADHELLIYFLPSAGSSIVATQTKQPLGQSGSTFPTAAGVISEVYLDVMEPDPDYAEMVAAVAYHELMHNKLSAFDPPNFFDIHSKGGGGLAVKTLTSGAKPSPENIRLMANALGKSHPQYTLGLSKKSPYP